MAPLRRGGCLGRLHRQRRLPRRQPAWRLGHWLPLAAGGAQRELRRGPDVEKTGGNNGGKQRSTVDLLGFNQQQWEDNGDIVGYNER